MAITLEKKKNAVSHVVNEIGKAGGILFTDFRGVNVDGMTTLRREIRKKNLKYYVSKRSLIARALSEANLTVPDEILDGATGLVFSGEEPIEAAKVLEEFRKDYPVFVVKGGVMGSTLLTAADVGSLANTPPRKVLLGMLASSLNAPINGLAVAAAGIIRGLVNALTAVAKSKGDG